MNELIKVETNESGEQLVSGRELHEFLAVKARYNDWFKRMIDYGFEENQDYLAITQKKVTAQGNTSEYTDHVLKLDMAKEVSMIQRNEKGKQARQYFIEVEKQFKQLTPRLPATYKEALIALVEEVEKNEKLEATIEEQKPLVTFAEKCIATDDSILVRELAKIAQDEGVKIGEKKLYAKLREWGLILQGKTEPSQKAMNMELFEVTQKTIKTPYGDKLTRQTFVLPKGQIYIIEKLMKELNIK